MTTSGLEQGLSFELEGETLIGVLHRASEDSAVDVGVVIVVGGPQYRVGSHRQFVQLARAVALAGFPVLRFDVRGMGDSTGAPRRFDELSADIGAAVDTLQRHMPQVRHVVLWGLCDGASAALLYVDERADRRVQGLVVVNPWVRSEASLARTHVKHYYFQRLMQREFWIKLLTGKVAGAALRGLLKNVATAYTKPGAAVASSALPYQARMGRAWRAFPGELLLVLSGNDYTAKEFIEFAHADPQWSDLLARPGLCREDVPGADHTFSGPADSSALEAATCRWLMPLAAPRGQDAGACATN